jgi:AcrR family transcriptional regulator
VTNFRASHAGESSEPPRGQQGRRRHGAELEEALLQAAWDEVTAVGYANLTMEGVAARAHTSKAVLYRRWPSRATLILAAVRRRVVPIRRDVPDTGDLREDVLAVLRHFRHYFQEIGSDVTHGLMTELQDLPTGVFEVVPGVIMKILERAAERGEVRLDKITPRIASLPGDLLRHEMMLHRGHVSNVFLAEIVDEVFLPLVRSTMREPTKKSWMITRRRLNR